MRGFSDCCHYDKGYDDGFDDGKDEVTHLGGDLTLADLIDAWARLQRDAAVAEVGFALADLAAANNTDLDYLSEHVKKRRERLLSQYAAATSATGDSGAVPDPSSERAVGRGQ